MYMYLYDLIIRYHNDRITDGFQIGFEFIFFLAAKRFIQHDQKLCTVSKFDLLICLCVNIRIRCTLSRLLLWCSTFDRIVDLLAEQCVQSAL